MSKKKATNSTGKNTNSQPLAEVLKIPQDEYLLLLAKQHDKFKDQLDKPYVRFEKNGHFEIHPLRSEAYKNHLIHELFSVYANKISRGAVENVIGIIESEIISTGVVHELHLRIAQHKDCIWYDLADSLWRAIKIDENGWSIVSKPPILFKRPQHMQEQVIPQKGGSLKTLFSFINVSIDFQLLMLVNLIACFIPETDYPICVFWGKAGTGKTNACRVLKSLVDPSKMDIISFPSHENEMIQVMSKNHLSAFDNINRISPLASDILCRASTGGAFMTRELYKNDEDFVRELHQPVVFNGLYQCVAMNDLISRCMFFELETIDSSKMETSSSYFKRFEQERPFILGRIFDCLATTLRVKKSIKIADHDRMGDFKDWGVAISKNFPKADKAFLKQLAKMDEIRNKEALLAQPLASAVEIFIRRNRFFSGYATALYIELCKVAKANKIDTRHNLWPKSANAMTRALGNMETNLEKAGIVYKHNRKNKGAFVEIILK